MSLCMISALGHASITVLWDRGHASFVWCQSWHVYGVTGGPHVPAHGCIFRWEQYSWSVSVCAVQWRQQLWAEVPFPHDPAEIQTRLLTFTCTTYTCLPLHRYCTKTHNSQCLWSVRKETHLNGDFYSLPAVSLKMLEEKMPICPSLQDFSFTQWTPEQVIQRFTRNSTSDL